MKRYSEIERLLLIDIDMSSSWEWSYGNIDRSIYNSLSEFQEVRKREFVHSLAVKLGIMQ